MKFSPVIVTLALGRRPDYAFAQETKAAKNDAKALKTKAPAAAKAAKKGKNGKTADTAAPTTMSPTASPTTMSPTASPTTLSPTLSPTASPSASPTTLSPTVSPTASPSASPTTLSPTGSPTVSPSVSPSVSPTTLSPSSSPSASPSSSPTPWDWKLVGEDIEGLVEDGDFGSSVALSNDGQILAVGGVDGGDKGDGEARMFNWDGTAWAQMGDTISGEGEFGRSVALSSDGTTLCAGAPSLDYVGHVQVYKWDGSQWAKLGDDITGGKDYDNLGISVSLSNDGNIVAVGSTGYDVPGAWEYNNGMVRVLEWDGTTWNKLGADITGLTDSYHNLGDSVSLSGDGMTVAAGAPWGGKGYVGIWKYNGTTWNQLGDDILGENTAGITTSLSDDGNTVAIGDPYVNSNKGHVRVWNYNGTNWNQLGGDFDGEANYDYLGYSVSLSDDGSRVVIGAKYASCYEGKISVYDYNGTDWNQLGSSVLGRNDDWRLGHSVAISGDGSSWAAGSISANAWNGTVQVYHD